MTSQHDAYVLHAGKVRVQVRKHMHMPGHPNAHVHTHGQVCNTYCCSTAKMIRKCASMLHCLSC
jgi:hypothetical protein